MNRRHTFLAVTIALLWPAAAAASCHDVTDFAHALARGIQARTEGQWDLAEACFRRAAQLPGGLAEASLEQARLALAKNGDAQTAEAKLKDARDFARDEDRPYYRLELGLFYLEHAGRETEARQELLAIHLVVADLILVTRFIGQERWDEAASGLKRIARNAAADRRPAPETIQALRALVRAWQIHGGPEAASRETWWLDAWAALDEALSSNPTHVLGNAVAGFLHTVPRPPQAPVPPSFDTVVARDRARAALEAALDLTEGLVFDVQPRRVNEIVELRLRNLRAWALRALGRLQLRDYALPKVSVVGRKQTDTIVTGHDHVWLLIRATDDRALRRIEIRPSWKSTPTAIQVKGDFYAKLHKIPLPSRPESRATPPVTITITAVDTADHQSDPVVTLSIERPTVTKRRAFLIGVEEYPPERELRPLPGLVRNDVDALYRHLIDPVRGGFRPDNVTVLVNEDVTSNNLEKVFEHVPMLEPDTEVIVYFSGHGGHDDGGFSCLFTQDRCKRLDTVMAPFRDAKPKWITVILDACFSGDPNILRNINWTGERNVLAAATKDTAALMRGGRSIVTSTLLEYLSNDEFARTIDRARSGRVRAEVAFLAVAEQLETQQRRSGFEQQIFKSATGGEQVLAWRPPEEVARDLLEDMTPDDPTLLKALRDAVAQPGTSELKSVVVDVLVDHAHRYIKGEVAAWHLLKEMTPYFLGGGAR